MLYVDVYIEGGAENVQGEHQPGPSPAFVLGLTAEAASVLGRRPVWFRRTVTQPRQPTQKKKPWLAGLGPT